MKALYSNPFLGFPIEGIHYIQCSEIAKAQPIFKTLLSATLSSKIHRALDVRQVTVHSFGCFLC